MLNIYRLHTKKCVGRDDGPKSRYDRKYRRCQCPIHVEGMIGGQEIRESLETANWTGAQRRISEAEARDSWEEVKPAGAEGVLGEPTQTRIEDARERFLRDAQHGRNIAEVTLKKYLLLFRDFESFTKKKGYRFIGEVTLDDLREFRESWFQARVYEAGNGQGKRDRAPLGARTALKKLERLRAFYRFCTESGWVEHNIAKALTTPKNIKSVPKLPFTEKQMSAIVLAAQQLDMDLGGVDPAWRVTNHDLVTFIYVMRYSGLRIGDACLLTPERFDGNRLYLYTEKTGTHVYVPLPPFVTERLKGVKLKLGKYYFTGPESSRMETAADLWRRKLSRVFTNAGVDHGHPHRFRHTFAVELLKKGAKIENVSRLLGHSSVRITEKHYAAWVQDRQDILEAEVTKTWVNFEVVEGGKKKAG